MAEGTHEVNEIHAAPAGTPLPTELFERAGLELEPWQAHTLDAALNPPEPPERPKREPRPIKGFEPIGFIVDEIRLAPYPVADLANFAAEYDGKPYVWGGRQNGKNTITEAFKAASGEFSIGFDVTGFVAEVWRALLFPKRRGLYTRTARHRRNKLRRKRAARRRQHR